MRTVAMLTLLTLAATPAVAQEHGHHMGSDTSHAAMHGMHDQAAMKGMHGQAGMMPMHGQEGMMPMHGGSGMMMPGGMMGMSPAMILELRPELDLNESQVTELESLREDAEAQMRRHMTQGMASMRAAFQHMDSAGLDLEAYEERIQEASEHMVEAHMAMARATVEARALLTEEQRARLEAASEAMQPGEAHHGG